MKERKITSAPPTPVGGEGYSRKFYSGKFRPRSSLLLFCISFEQESNPFCIPLIHKRYPFSKLFLVNGQYYGRTSTYQDKLTEKNETFVQFMLCRESRYSNVPSISYYPLNIFAHATLLCNARSFEN